MKLYSGPVSLFSAKVRIALDEKRLPCEHVSVGWSLECRYEPHHPEVLAQNPKRQVPVLVDGDVVVYDSTLIFEYLEDRYPQPALYPADVSGRARCRRLEALADEIVFQPVWDLVEEVFYPPSGNPSTVPGRDARRAERARARLAELHAELDRELAGREYLCGSFSVADIAAFVMISTGAALGASPDPTRTHLIEWLARTAVRPAVRRETDAMHAFVASLRAAPAETPKVAAAAAPA
jgi:glutathione S-transferase